MRIRKFKALSRDPLSEELDQFLEQVLAASHAVPVAPGWIGGFAEKSRQVMLVSWPRGSNTQARQEAEEILLLIDDVPGSSPEVGLAHRSKQGCRLLLFGSFEWDGDFPYPDAPSEADLQNQILWMLEARLWDKACETERLWALNGRRLWGMRRVATEAGGILDYRQVDIQVCFRLASAMRQSMRSHEHICDVNHFVNALDEASRTFLQGEISNLHEPLVNASH